LIYKEICTGLLVTQ